MPNVLTLETNKYPIKIENFEGPLDLLCHLIDKNKMDISDVKISQIADQYIEYINKMEEMNLEVTSEFLVMASTLLYLKSKKLLPRQDDNVEEELTEEELIQRIIEYKKYKEITSEFRKLFANGYKNIYRPAEILSFPKQKLDERQYTIDEITKTYTEILQRSSMRLNKNAKNIEKIAITETYSVASTVKRIFKELIKKPSFVFNKVFSISSCNRQEVVTAFSGLLEMSRRSKITTDQKETFGDIVVNRKKRNL